MLSRKSFRPAAFALALSLAGLAPSAQALNIVLNDVGTTKMSAEQLGAFQTAANYWSGKLTDNVTVYVNIAFSDLAPNVLGSTGSSRAVLDYGSLRSGLATDAKSVTDALAVASLPAGSSLSFLATQGDLTTRLDNDGSTNNKQFVVNTANLKALGLDPGTNASNPDARIEFANGFASSFAFTRANGGVPSNKVDFITVAEHEIGHALGFASGVDSIDFCVGHTAQCGLSGAPNEFEVSPWYTPLDMFRYSAAGQRDVTLGGSPYFSVNGGLSSVQPFSTGLEHGNGQQASHFGTSVVTLMRPFVGNGQSYDATVSDLMAFDAIGWDLAAAVPEPSQYALLLAGLALIGMARRRKRD
ncbi:NF038122 family metalloprotease [Roseateles sp. P5_D6]